MPEIRSSDHLRPEHLPVPPPAKNGWPWTAEPEPWPAKMPDGSDWPRVCIVTPSLNQGGFIEETIRSVLLQGYPRLEYFIVDGGSTDSTLEVIRKYAPWLAYWTSEPDQGQSHAINKGFGRCRSDILAWLNADDFYEPNALKKAVEAFHGRPEAVLIYGDCVNIDESGARISLSRSRLFDRDRLIRFWPNYIAQPSTFFRCSAFKQVGGLDLSLHYAMDYDLWIRLTGLGPAHYLPHCLARFRVHSASKTGAGSATYWPEMRRVSRAHGGGFWSPMYIQHLRDGFYLFRRSIKKFLMGLNR